MKIIEEHKGKKKGQKSISIYLKRQRSNEQPKTITVAGNISIKELYAKLMFFLKSLEESNKGVDILIKK